MCTLFRLSVSRIWPTKCLHRTERSASLLCRHSSNASGLNQTGEPTLDKPGQASSSSTATVPVSEQTSKNETEFILDARDGSSRRYPNLMKPSPLLDTHQLHVSPPTRRNPYRNEIVVRNDSSIFLAEKEAMGLENADVDESGATEGESEDEVTSLSNLPFTPAELSKLHRFPMIARRITQQTGKGKIHRQYAMVVVGNGDGLLGYGEGKDEDLPRASEKAFAEAVRNMDYVDRFEKRTIWTDMDTKLGATRIILRPRPVGFGLRCNPNIHQVLKAAGIKDISAKVWGSRNPMNVIKALFRMLQSGNAPLAMGDGIGGKGRKLNKGSGVLGKEEVERARGRKLIDLRY